MLNHFLNANRRYLFLINHPSCQIKRYKNDYSKTLNLPNCGKFELSMKRICEHEDNIKKIAEFDSLYDWQAKNRANRPLYTLHDGPPYANGDIHIGHMVNKVLKDICLRFKLLSGYQINYIPGWDCHGLPIELNAIKNLKKKSKKNQKKDVDNLLNNAEPLEIRNFAKNYAESCINTQMETFKKMNLLADWSKIYRTIDPKFMCKEIDLFYSLYENKLIYRDYMPVYWSISSQTALAEFELEYNPEHKSNALYVAYELVEYSTEIKKFLKPDQKLYVPIWTTTPWSLPCNKAIAFNPSMNYGLISVNDSKVFIVQADLISNVIDKVPFFQNSSFQTNFQLEGKHLSGSFYTSRFSLSPSALLPLLPSDHVGSKQGTGLVHIAPALGQDDFKIALKHNLDTNCVIDELGRYTIDDLNLKKFDLNGKSALDSTTIDRIKEILGESILGEHDHIHSYPYDWRTKKPCIIRSSMQWFIDTNRLKEKALDVLKNVKIKPNNVSNSMITTLSSRPYWCISRQRSWGLPIPCLYNSDDKDKKYPIIDKQMIEKIKDLINQEGSIDFWWSNKHDKHLFESIQTKNDNFLKSKDIFDIWFDSGSSFNSVLGNEAKADLYCEGVDQFSGWFQASLLLSVALNNTSPYKNLLVHGFVVDEHNRKMSKSVGNVIEPLQAVKGVPNKLPQAGLDTLRFWIAHEHHKPQIQIGAQILEKFVKRAFEMRSILRFLVGNLYDFKQTDLVDYDQMWPIDKYILGKLSNLSETVYQNYEDMNLSKSINLVENFLLSQISSFYIKSTKDRLYCEKNDSLERRSAQTAIYHLLVKLLVMIGPVMPHLAEEAFHYSILARNIHKCSLFRSELDFKCEQVWKNYQIGEIFELIEILRNQFFEKIQSDNSALYEVILECDPLSYTKLDEIKKKTGSYNWLTECFGSADVNVNLKKNVTNEISDLLINLNVEKVNKLACARCRKYNCDKYRNICSRCQQALNF